MTDTAAEIERMARKIALWHGQKMIYRNRDGMQTVASSRGFGNWGWSASDYADRHWHEYTAAAEQILKEKPPTCDTPILTGAANATPPHKA